jgi:hypothetical protein
MSAHGEPRHPVGRSRSPTACMHTATSVVQPPPHTHTYTHTHTHASDHLLQQRSSGWSCLHHSCTRRHACRTLHKVLFVAILSRPLWTTRPLSDCRGLEIAPVCPACIQRNPHSNRHRYIGIHRSLGAICSARTRRSGWHGTDCVRCSRLHWTPSLSGTQKVLSVSCSRCSTQTVQRIRARHSSSAGRECAAGVAAWQKQCTSNQLA